MRSQEKESGRLRQKPFVASGIQNEAEGLRITFNQENYMQEIFEKLKSLQVISIHKVYGKEMNLETYPIRLKPKLVYKFNRGKKNYLERITLSERIDELKAFSDSIDDAEKIRENYEKQMDLITTQREYEALDKEINDAAEKEQQLRKAILHKEKTLEDLKYQLEEQEESPRSQQEEEVTTEQQKMQQIFPEKRTNCRIGRAGERAYLDIDPEVIFKFERIIKNKSGV